MESAQFVLTNNNFDFDGQIYNQSIGTAMGTDFAPDYACLSMGFLEETKLFPSLINHFSAIECKCIKDNHMRYIDDGFTLYPNSLILNCSNNYLTTCMRTSILLSNLLKIFY